MNIGLKDFQEEAVSELLKELRNAKGEVLKGGLQAVVLSSPTGSGKTVITTSLIEDILQGTDEIPSEEAVFLWFSDQPELNEQSRKKILNTSDRIRENDIEIIGPEFDQDCFDSGKLYFINTQKLGKDKILVTKGDSRAFTIWETIQNTSDKYGDKFYLVIDEAHRGMNATTREKNLSRTIVQKLILGDESEGVEPVKMILGISATPERFLDVLHGTEQYTNRRIPRIIQVNPEEVRNSGLLKDQIVLFHPEVEEFSDWTLLSAAAKQWKAMKEEWNNYTTSQGIEPQSPAMIIQVEDRSETSISKTDLEKVIDGLEEVVGPLDEDEIAHCFEEDVDISVGDKKIKKIEPSRIQEKTRIKFVFFKMSLTTGWDCPRAEVMMSFRKAQDHTLIAQLIGRMVRTPLARRIEGQEALNSVSLYLPYYDREGLNDVIKYMKADSDVVPPTNMTDGNNQKLYKRSCENEEIIKAIERIPTYKIDSARKTSYARRLMKLSRLLTSFHNIDAGALDESKELIVGKIHSFKEKLRQADAEFDYKLNEADEIYITPVVVKQGVWEAVPGEPVKVKISDANISELFTRCGKRLGEGLHMDYWSKYYERSNPNIAKLELFLTLQHKEVFDEIEEVCKQRLKDLFDRYKSSIRKLRSSEQEKYHKIREQAKTPEDNEFLTPSKILVNLEKGHPQNRRVEKHLYVDDQGEFITKLNSWEFDTIQEEIDKENVVTWIRNYDRKYWSLSIPYIQSSKYKPLYPDFIVVRKENEEYLIDILEPHREDLEDNWVKAVGLAQYADTHWASLGRIELIRKVGNRLKRLDLNDDIIRQRVLTVTSNGHLNTIFNTDAI